MRLDLTELDLKDFKAETAAVVAPWRHGGGAKVLWASAEVGPLLLEIRQESDGAIGWISCDARVGGGVMLWRSRNEKNVPICEVIDGMRDYLRYLSEELATCQGGPIDG